MQAVNKKMDPKKTMQTLQNFQKETAKMDMTEEMSKMFLFIYLLLLWVILLVGFYKIMSKEGRKCFGQPFFFFFNQSDFNDE